MRPKSRGPRLLDLMSLVVGYGLAALVFRAIWRGSSEIPYGIVAALVYAWFGLAISGPIILFLDRRTLPKPKTAAQPPRKPRRVSDPEIPFQIDAPSPPPFSRAEQAWIMIGVYCTLMTLVLVPARLGDTPLGIIAVLQLLSGFVLFFLDPRRPNAGVPQLAWTHTAAHVVLIGWPFAWIGLILLLKT